MARLALCLNFALFFALAYLILDVLETKSQTDIPETWVTRFLLRVVSTWTATRHFTASHLAGSTRRMHHGRNPGKNTQEHDSRATANTKAEPHQNTIDRNAPAGSKNSLGEESIRDGRPSTSDDVVEAKDEEGPGIN